MRSVMARMGADPVPVQIIITLAYPLVRFAARRFVSWTVLGSARVVDRVAQRRHDKDPKFPLPHAAKFYADVSFVDLFAIPMTDVITTMGTHRPCFEDKTGP